MMLILLSFIAISIFAVFGFDEKFLMGLGHARLYQAV